MKRIIILVVLSTMSFTLEAKQNSIADQVTCSRLGIPDDTDLCSYFYESFIQNQKDAVNYNNLSSHSKANLNTSMRVNLDGCLNRCSGAKLSYCDDVQKKIEASAEQKRKQLAKSKSWF